MSKFYIPVLLGTARQGRQSEKIAHFIASVLGEYEEVETGVLDVRDYLWGETIGSWHDDARIQEWKEIVRHVDGFVIVSPEYNHGYPGELKILLDAGDRADYARKPVALCGVSSGGLGGARVVEQLQQVVLALLAIPVAQPLYFSNVEDSDPNNDPDLFRPNVANMTDELLWHARKLRT
jgi:NAD(P)H-dependent FMN reductase